MMGEAREMDCRINIRNNAWKGIAKQQNSPKSRHPHLAVVGKEVLKRLAGKWRGGFDRDMGGTNLMWTLFADLTLVFLGVLAASIL